MSDHVNIKPIPQSKRDLRKLARALLLLVEADRARANGTRTKVSESKERAS